MKRKALNTFLLTALVLPAVAMAADTHTVSSNVSLTTDYLYRGISQTGGKAALQGGFDYAHASGFYAGVWGSNISWISDAGVASGASVELDTYAGFKGELASEVSFDVGFLRYNYPGYYPAGTTKADTNEVYGGLGWKWVSFKYSHSLGDTFGTPGAGGTSYIDLGASYTLEDAGVTLAAHYGKQTYKGTTADALKAAGADPSYADYKLSASKDVGGYAIGVTYSATNAKKGGFYSLTQADGTVTDLGKGTLVLSVSHAM